MAVTLKQFTAAQYLTGSAATYYTATNCTARVDNCTFTNTDTVAVPVTVYLIASGGTVNAVTFADSGALWALVWFGAGNGFPGRQRAQVRALGRAQLYLQGQSFAGR